MQFLKKISDSNNSQNEPIIDMSFSLPITYLKNKFALAENVKADLELLDNQKQKSLYCHILGSTLETANPLISQWGEYYTNNTAFLKDSQYLLKHYCPIDKSNTTIPQVQKIIAELDNETGFCEKYKYMDIKFLEPLNRFPSFLQILTVYNLASPIISLAIPIVMLIMPFFLLKIQGVSVSIQAYVTGAC